VRAVHRMSLSGVARAAVVLIPGVLCGAVSPARAAPFERAGLIRVPASQYENFVALSRRDRGPDPAVLARGLHAFSRARARHDIRRNILTLIDYRLPSDEKRLWVIDLDAGRVLFHELVAHGEKTGKARATAFSNRMGSHQSSLGTFVTRDTYVGRHGYSLRLQGMDPGINDRAMERAIVMHGADYVSDDFVARYGRLGRSWGCPALPVDAAQPVIDAIKHGSVLFSYYPDPVLERDSRYLR